MGRPQSVFPGDVYGRLTVVRRSPTNSRYFDCRCSCGNATSVFSSHLRRGATTSCGCYHKEVTSAAMTLRQTKHGLYGTKVYGVWNSMMDRCCNPKNHAYAEYGGRGISVTKRWCTFQNFFLDMGHPPTGLTLERKNNNLGYSKSNCKWATRKEQMNNRRVCVMLRYKRMTKTITGWAEELNISRDLIYTRITAGWDVVRALTTPSRKQA